MYWSVIDPIWDTIEIDTDETFIRTFANVPRSLGLLYAAHFCQSEVYNGGFTQFFSNSTGVLAPEAVEGFAAIGQKGVAKVVQRAMGLLPSPYNRNRASRWSDLANLSDEPAEQGAPAPVWRYRDLEVFKSIDKEFYSLISSEAGGFEKAADAYAERLSAEAGLR